ncbi:response regulator [Desulforhabdus amnigena]|jgi:DNA-binding NtrC family response regulator|uniref:Response regulator n=1 Tax=Desulforhabdus amnigena TaxID=40218 RepID=A0A9W6FX15_9BACT|nr:response regulator [Desulforhabdus amnigena]NLJ27130.1 response regulator [Deltaproteobacteria bacterium]GLI36397.1 response regulator [Desulforhabdus amnigena]
MAKILVLDDIADVGILIRKILKGKGHEVFAFTEEEEAISFVRSHPVDLAILDIKLKKMTGIEVLEELKKMDPHIHAMMLTGYPTLETARAALKLGVDEYCVKPLETDELEQKVERILESTGQKMDDDAQKEDLEE